MKSILRTMKRFLSLRFFAKLVAGLVVLGLIVVAVENWTGARALAKARADFLSEGEVFSFAALQPKHIAEASNFFAIEQLAGISEPRREKESPLHQKLQSLDWMFAAIDKQPKAPRPNLNGGCTLGEPLDVKSVAAYLSEISYIDTAPDADAARVLAAIDRMHPLLKQLSDAAVGRPEACFDHRALSTNTEAPYKLVTPHLNGTLGAAKALELRAQIAVEAGDSESAVRSIQAGLRVTQALGQEPLLIGLLCATTTATFDSNSLWLLLHRHTASAEQLARLQADLERRDFMRYLLHSIRGEMVWQSECIDWYKLHRDDCLSAFSQVQIFEEQAEPSWYAYAAVRMIPSGWFDHNAANVLRLGSTYLLKPATERDGGGIARNMEELESLLNGSRRITAPHHLLSALAFPAFDAIILQAVYCEAMRRQAITAIAIERYRLAHSKLPAALAELVPEFLPAVPQDVMDLAPLRYRVDGDGEFTLWSVAWDGKDDGGKRPNAKDAKRISRPQYAGDWVWKN